MITAVPKPTARCAAAAAAAAAAPVVVGLGSFSARGPRRRSRTCQSGSVFGPRRRHRATRRVSGKMTSPDSRDDGQGSPTPHRPPTGLPRRPARSETAQLDSNGSGWLLSSAGWRVRLRALEAGAALELSPDPQHGDGWTAVSVRPSASSSGGGAVGGAAGAGRVISSRNL